MGATENAKAGAVDRDLLAFDEVPEGIAVAIEHGIHERSVIHGSIVPRNLRHLTSIVVVSAVVVAVTPVIGG